LCSAKFPKKIFQAFIRTVPNFKRNNAVEEKAFLEEQLYQSQKMEAISSLAGGIAHNFNNLLAIINGYSQLALMNLDQRDLLKGNIEEVKKAAERASALTQQLLIFSRRQILELRTLNLNTLIQDLDQMLRKVIGENINLVMHLSENLGMTKVDPEGMQQVIMNLVINSMDAMPNGGKLTIESANVELDEGYAQKLVFETPGRYVLLAVTDTGIGMTHEISKRIFEPFFTTKKKGQGAGLGLPTVYGIVKQSGGNIWVYSEPGRGTTVKIYLPRVD
jgi:two-component system cell cycle sensor histidine kinase/response regulator CckA